MIDNLTRQLSDTKRSIARGATMLNGGRMILPAGLLACAAALGLFAQAGSHSAQAYFRDSGSAAWSTAGLEPMAEAVYWDEPAYPGSASNALRAEVDTQEEVNCLALNIYFEARNEPSQGQRAVAHVVMNRVADPRFPDSVCRVVRQGGEQVRHRCQFSWWCDGRSDRPKNYSVWERAQAIARDVYWGRSEDPSQGALWYHADYVMPYWGRVFERGPKIGRHIFYSGRKERVQIAASQKAE